MVEKVLYVLRSFILLISLQPGHCIIDEQWYVVQHEVGTFFSLISLFWSLKADESVGTLSIFSFEYSARFDFAKLAENLSHILFAVTTKAFNVQIAALFREFVVASFAL